MAGIVLILVLMTASSPIHRWRIVVPVHNALQDVVTLLKRLEGLNADLLACLILVDDGSTDGTTEFVSGQYPQVHFVHGDGNLWWGGGIRLGMQTALDQDADLIFWLNHDCFPLPGAFEKIAGILANPKVGCVSGWCRIKGYPDYPVNPGFLAFRPLTMAEDSALVEADGVNGNFVGFRTDAVTKVGLPDAESFPHYGDGVYTIRFSRAGFKVLVCTSARADLEFELERRLSPFWRVAVNRGGLQHWLVYYFFSPRSLFNLANRFRQIYFFVGITRALIKIPLLSLCVTGQVCGGLMFRVLRGTKLTRQSCINYHTATWPQQKLKTELDALDNMSNMP